MSRSRPFRRVYGRWMVLPPARSRFVEIREGRGCVFFNICIRCSGFRKYSGYTVPLAHFNIIDRDRLRRPPSFPLLPEISRIRPLAPQLISPFSNPWLYRPGLRKGAPRRCRHARSGGPIHAHALRMLPLSPTVRPPMSTPPPATVLTLPPKATPRRSCPHASRAGRPPPSSSSARIPWTRQRWIRGFLWISEEGTRKGTVLGSYFVAVMMFLVASRVLHRC